MITISLVIPVLGECGWLNETIQSIIRQTFPRDGFEAIIVADEAMQGRATDAASLLDAGGIHTTVVTQQRCNAAAARNAGWRASAAEWVQFLDSGDVITSDKLELQAGGVEQLSPDVDVVCAKWQHLGLANGEWKPFGPVVSPMFSDPAIVRLAAPDRQGWVGPILIRKTALERVGGYSEEQDVAGDDRLVRQIAATGGRIVELPSQSPLFLMRQVPGQRSRFWLRHARVARHLGRPPHASRQPAAQRPTGRAVAAIASLPRKVALSLTSSLAAFRRLAQSSLASARGIGTDVARAVAPIAGRAAAAARAVLLSALWLARLPLAASRSLAIGVAAAGAWSVVKLVSGMRSVRDGALKLAKLPVIACQRIAAGVLAAAASARAGLAVATTLALEGVRWLARGPLTACGWIAAGVATAFALTFARLAAAAVTTLEGIRWLGRLPLIAYRSIAAGVATASTRIVDLIISATTIIFRSMVWLVRLPVAASRSLMRGLTSVAAWTSQRAAAIGRGVSYSAERAWGARRYAFAALAALAMMGGLIGVIRLYDPSARTPVAGKVGPTPALVVADASTPQTPTEAPPVASRPNAAPDTPPRALELQPVATAIPADVATKLPPGPAPGTAQPSDAPPAQPSSRGGAPETPADPNPPYRPAGSATVAESPPITTASLPLPTAARDPSPDAMANAPLPQPATGEPRADTRRAAAAEPGGETSPSPSQQLRPTGVGNHPEPAKATEGAAIVASAAKIESSASEAVSPARAEKESSASQPDRSGDAGQAQAAIDSPERPSGLPAPVQPSPKDDNAPAASASPDKGQQPATPPVEQAAAPVPLPGSQPAATVEPAPGANRSPPSVATLPEARPAAADKSEAPASAPVVAERTQSPNAAPAPTIVVAAVERTPARPSVTEPAAPPPPAVAPEGNDSKPPLLAPEEREQAEKLVARGERELGYGNIALARQFFVRAAKLGLARGALLLASTYDARELRRLSVVGVQPNEAMAREWYQQARSLGAPEADERLAHLGTP